MLRPSVFSDNYTNSLFHNFFDDMFSPMSGIESTNAMNTDIRELDDAYQIDMELPGFSKDDVKAELEDGYMTIEATHTKEKDEQDEKEKYVRKERYTGSYGRSFYVGDAVTKEDIKAKFSNGVLSITIPRKEDNPKVEQKTYIAIEG